MRKRSGVSIDIGTEAVFEGTTTGREQLSEAAGTQRPIQLHLLAEGEVEPARLRSAWQKIAEGVSAKTGLTTNGNGNGNGTSHGVKRAPWQEHDLRGLPEEQARKWINSFLETDGVQEVSTQRYPAMRCALLLTDQQECELVWTFHPALSAQIDVERAIAELMTACPANVRIKEIGAPSLEQTVQSTLNGSERQRVKEVGDGIPEDEAERDLAAIWEKVLNTKAVKIDDDFFDLGGHSLLAARLLARIEDALGVELPLASLLEAPTVRGQAQLLRKFRGNASPETRARQGNLTQLPLFFLGGDPTFRPLSQRLSELREFHSLGLRMSEIAKLRHPRSLESIAEQFIQSIRERRPSGRLWR